jgi:hypothetical protein
MSVYEVIAVRYGTRTGAKSEIYLNYPTYGEPDEPLGMDYYFWVAHWRVSASTPRPRRRSSSRTGTTTTLATWRPSRPPR